MQIPVRVSCPKCNQAIDLKVDTNENSLNFTCPECGSKEAGSIDQNSHIGNALLHYASSVLSSGDTNFSILLSAMAMDCYLSRLYYKWRDIEELRSTASYDVDTVDKKIQEELIKTWNFLKKVKEVEILLHPNGITDFINSQADLKEEIAERFPAIKIDLFSRCIRDQVMWKRNNIIHIGKFKYSYQEARKSLELSHIFIKIFEIMDRLKSQTY
jgi:predicted RNA-binding Zn-ribbon protein involved in translation (DUF1610 family)